MLSLGSAKGEIELCKSSSRAKAQRMHLALPDPSVRWKRYESVMDSVMSLGPAFKQT